MKDAWLKIYVASRSLLRIPASANLASSILVHGYSGDKVNRVQDLQGQFKMFEEVKTSIADDQILGSLARAHFSVSCSY